MILSSLLVLSALLPAPQGDLRLPPPRPAQPETRPVAADEVANFRRTLVNLRTAGDQFEIRLQALPQQFRDLEGLIIQVARQARSREMQDLMAVARRYGTTKVGDELLFQLLTRSMGEATRDVIAAMAQLKGNDAKAALKECVRGRQSAVRRAATELLVGMMTVEDLPFALELSGDQALDLQLAGCDLLGAVADERAWQRLVELLAKEATVAGAACTQLLRIGAPAVPALQQALAAPPIDRTHAYAAFVLAQTQAVTGQEVLPPSSADVLRRGLDDPDPAVRSLAAVALAELAFRSDDPDPARFRDADVVRNLVAVASPQAFVPNLSLLREPVEARLQALTGRTPGDGVSWAEWWAGAESGFQGLRAAVRVDAENAGRTVIELRRERQHLRLLGEDLAGTANLAGAEEMVLTATAMLDLVRRLKTLGFMAGGPARAIGVAAPGTLQLQVQGARCQTVALPGSAEFDRLAAALAEVADGEIWQLYRDPAEEPDRAAFWRAERRWLDANPAPIERSRRFLRRVIAVWPAVGADLRGRALARLLAEPDKHALLGEAEADRMLELAALPPAMGPHELALLELAAATPGDRIWRRCIDLAWTKDGGGRPAVMKLFALLGPDRVLAALTDERAVVRQAAIDEVVRMRDLRASGRLVTLLDDADPAVARAAAFAVGAVPVAEARTRVIELIAAPATEPLLRRECLRSLGRIGGDGAFAVLQRAMEAPAKEDRDAALRGIGELREMRAAGLMAELFVAGQGNENGELARFYLQRMGALLAVPALRPHLTVATAAARREVVLLLGQLQDPQIVPELIEMLRQGQDNLPVTAMLEAITGLDVSGREDRVVFLEQWWRLRRADSQWQWLLAALRADTVETTLKPEQFTAGAGLAPLPELARLLVELPQPRLRMLTAAVMRTVANEDFGPVTPQSTPAALEALAARYRVLYEAGKAAIR